MMEKNLKSWKACKQNKNAYLIFVVLSFSCFEALQQLKKKKKIVRTTKGQILI